MSRAGTQIHWAYVLAGFSSQAACAYLDAARGPLLPATAQALHLEFMQSGWFFAVSHIAASLSTLLLIWALNLWPERLSLMAISLVGVIAAGGAGLVTDFPRLLVLAAMLGASITTLGTMANVLVVEGTPPAKQGRMLSGLHATYGLGCMLASAGVGLGLSRGLPWPALYGVAVPLYGGLLIFAWFGMDRQPQGRSDAGPRAARTVQPTRLSPLQILVVLVFSIYVAAEIGTSMWMTTYLTHTYGFTVAQATPYLTGFFLVMMLTRLACAALHRPELERLIIAAALGLPILAFVLAAAYGQLWGLAMMGVCGPFFPVCLARLSRSFPTLWRTITIWVMVMMNVSVGICDVVIGKLADGYGISSAFIVPAALFALALALLLVFFRGERLRGIHAR